MAHYHFRWSQTSRTFQHFKCFFPSWITWEFCYVIYVDCWIRWRSIFFFIINILISLNRKKGQRSWSFEYDFHQDCFHYVVMIVLKIFYSIWWEHFFFALLLTQVNMFPVVYNRSNTYSVHSMAVFVSHTLATMVVVPLHNNNKCVAILAIPKCQIVHMVMHWMLNFVNVPSKRWVGLFLLNSLMNN